MAVSQEYPAGIPSQDNLGILFRHLLLLTQDKIGPNFVTYHITFCLVTLMSCVGKQLLHLPDFRGAHCYLDTRQKKPKLCHKPYEILYCHFDVLLWKVTASFAKPLLTK
jgi:hypothetical protein